MLSVARAVSCAGKNYYECYLIRATRKRGLDAHDAREKKGKAAAARGERKDKSRREGYARASPRLRAAQVNELLRR